MSRFGYGLPDASCVTEAIAERWGNLAATAKQKGMTLAVVDGVIAATALHHDLTVVTRNVKDFAGLGADIFNPWDDTIPQLN
jgi:toxin FitB